MSKLGWPGVLWMSLSMLAAVAASCGFFMPFWLKGSYSHTGPDPVPVYLGTFRRCNYPRLMADGTVELVKECGRYTSFGDIPSVWWQISTVACGAGSALALLVASAGVSALCIRDVLTRTTSKAAAALQFLAGMLIGGAMAVYPLGWSSGEIKHVCGADVSPFRLGNCRLHWAFYLTASAGGLTLICSMLVLCAPPRKASYL